MYSNVSLGAKSRHAIGVLRFLLLWEEANYERNIFFYVEHRVLNFAPVLRLLAWHPRAPTFSTAASCFSPLGTLLEHTLKLP